MAGKKKRSTRFTSGVLGLVVVVASAVLAVFALNSAKGLPGEAHTYVEAQFTNTGDLHVDDDLREADVRVGRVDSIDYQGNGVGTVRLQFDDDKPVYKNATVQVVSRSGLGQKYVNISRGDPAAGVLPSDGVIPASQTQPAVEILDLASIFDPKTTTAAQGALGQLGAGMEGHAKDLSDAVDAVPSNLPRLATVARALNNNNGRDIQTVLTSLRDLSSSFQGRQQQITDLNRQLSTTFDAVNVNGGRSLADLLKVAPGAFADVRKALVDLQQPLETTTAAVTNIRPGVDDLAAATPDVRGVLREAPKPLDKVPGVSDVGQPALEALTPALHDLRPLVVDIRTAAQNARLPLACLAPLDVGHVFTNLAILVRQGDTTGNAARFVLVPQGGIVGGVPTQTELNQFTNVRCPQPDFDHGGGQWGDHGGDHGDKPGDGHGGGKPDNQAVVDRDGGNR
ncbi:MlaD family protein [Actinomycetospora sp. TBRC 11914]|uniref:MlaD family protein n=1 Tax=Actinomycetospora sp. TBRC 11914 TaxID=2729387 RepID=UPI00145EBCC8|nr:MlaD family protein [Actinomycetospora sp. TBRC 11914]NMO92270.1 MCE family protein [Actinomycetospora sp. TBRC 11914]